MASCWLHSDQHLDYIDSIKHYSIANNHKRSLEFCDSLLILKSDSSKKLSYIYKGFILYELGEYKSSLNNYYKSYDYILLNGTSNQKGNINISIGKTYYGNKNYLSALNYFQEAIKFDINTYDLFETYNYIGLAYYYADSITLSRKYLKKADSIAKALDDISLKDIVLNNLALTLNNEGELSKLLESYDYAQSLKDTNSMMISCNNIAEELASNGNYELAIDYYLKTLTLNTTFQEKDYSTLVYQRVINIFYKTKQYQSAIDLEPYLDPDEHENLILAYKDLIKSASQLNRTDLVEEYTNKLTQSSIAVNKSTNDILSFSSANNIDKSKEKTIWIKKYNNQSMIISNGLIILFVSAIIILFIVLSIIAEKKRHKQRAEELTKILENQDINIAHYENILNKDVINLGNEIMTNNEPKLHELFATFRDKYTRLLNRQKATKTFTDSLINGDKDNGRTV